MLVGPRETPPIIPNYPPKQAPSITLVRPCCVTIGCWHTQSHTKLAREQSNLFSKGLNVIDSIQNQKGPDIAPMGVLASFSRPRSPPAKNFPEYCRSRLKKIKMAAKINSFEMGQVKCRLLLIQICRSRIRSYFVDLMSSFCKNGNEIKIAAKIKIF